MAMNTPYLGSSATVPANLNTSYISTGLTEVTSALSVWGPVTFLGTMPQFSTVSASVGTFATSIAVGGGTAVKAFDSILTSVGQTPIAASSQTEFQVAFANSALSDFIGVAGPSSISAGVVATSYVSSAGTVILRLANVTTSALTQAARVWRLVRIGF